MNAPHGETIGIYSQTQCPMPRQPLQLEIEPLDGSAGLPKAAAATGLRDGDERGFVNRRLNCKNAANV